MECYQLNTIKCEKHSEMRIEDFLCPRFWLSASSSFKISHPYFWLLHNLYSGQRQNISAEAIIIWPRNSKAKIFLIIVIHKYDAGRIKKFALFVCTRSVDRVLFYHPLCDLPLIVLWFPFNKVKTTISFLRHCVNKTREKNVQG